MSNGAMDGTFHLTCRQHRRCDKCRPITAAPPTSCSRDVTKSCLFYAALPTPCRSGWP